MNKKHLPTQKMLFQFNDFVNLFKVKLEIIPSVWELISTMLLLGVSFNEAIRIQSADYGGYTISKRHKKERLAYSLINILNLLYNHSVKSNHMDEIKNFKSTLKKLLRLSYTSLFEKSNVAIEYCDSHSNELLDIGISVEMLQALKDDILAMKTYIPLPQEMKKKKGIATKDVENLGNEIDELQIDRLDKLMATFFEESDPKLHTAYKQAVKRVNPASRKIALMGSVKNKNTQKPIIKAHILIPKAGIDHLCKGAKGGFRIPTLEPNTYEVEVKAVNFITKKLTLVHNYGETDKLDIVLEPELVV